MQKITLIVGRFQPFHKGHLFLIKKALKIVDKIVVGIGSANITDVNNPIDFETRKKVIKAIAYKEKFENKLLKIVPLDDFLDDKKWLENLKKQVGEFDLALGNNQWTNNILKKAGYKVLKVEYFKRGIYEGWRIRKLIKEGKKWQNRVPKYLISNIKDQISKPQIKNQKFKHVVLGGTFDHFHEGHEALLSKAFEVGKIVTIGIATEEIYKDKLLSETVESFEIRKKSVSEFLKKKGWLLRAKLISFSHFTGGADKEKEIDAIVVSRETFPNALKINKLRKDNHLKPLMIAIIEDVLAEDGKLISSERIRAGEIDREGKKYQISNIKYQKEIIMPESLRPALQKPLGKIFDSVYKVIKFIKFIKPIQLIAVGDIIVDSLLKEGIDPDVKVIDFKSRRKPLKMTGPVSCLFLPPRGGTVGIPRPSTPVINNPGTINLKTAGMIKEKIRLALFKKDKSWLVIDGEEDLLALPAILFAPLGSLILYGHWQHGIIAVEINEKIKNRVKKIIKKFN